MKPWQAKNLLKAQVAQARANPRCLEMASDPKAHPAESELAPQRIKKTQRS